MLMNSGILSSAFGALREEPRPAPSPRRTPIAAIARRRASAFGGACGRMIPAVMEKSLFFGGLIAVVCGCWMIYRPLGPLVGGGVAIWLGMLVSIERSQVKPKPARSIE